MYVRGSISPERVGSTFKRAYTLFQRKYYFDELYEDVLVRRVFYGGLANMTDWFDKNWIDSANSKIAGIAGRLGADVRQIQSGQAQTYAIGIIGGLIVALAAFLIWGT